MRIESYNNISTPEFTGLNLRLNKGKNKFFRINDLSNKYIDRFIQIMADSSEKKHINSITLDVLPRLDWVDLPVKEGGTPFKSWYIKSLFPSKAHCIFFHGGTSTVSNYQNLYKSLSNRNINILAVEYPGYGENKHLEASYGALSDVAQSSYKYLTENLKVNPNDIAIMGYCLGGQVATNLASVVNCRSLLLVSPISKFSQISEGYIKSKNIGETFVNKFHKWFVETRLFKSLLANKLSSYKYIDGVSCPVYVLSSEKDPVTHIKWMDKIVKSFLDRDKRLIYFRGFEDGHKLTDSKIDILSRVMSVDIFKP